MVKYILLFLLISSCAETNSDYYKIKNQKLQTEVKMWVRYKNGIKDTLTTDAWHFAEMELTPKGTLRTLYKNWAVDVVAFGEVK